MITPEQALTAIGQLPDDEIDIADAALHFARVDAPQADWIAARLSLSALARDAARLTDPSELADLIAHTYGYWGGDEDYDDPANANLIRVVERRRGLPVALGVIWLHAIRAAGWTGFGIDYPGHFLLALHDGSERLIDVFAGGRELDPDSLSPPGRREDAFAPMSTRAVLMRLQNNIRIRRLQSRDLDGALRCTLDMLRVVPGSAALWQDAADINESAGRPDDAAVCRAKVAALTVKSR